MRLKRRIAAERLVRVRERARAAALNRLITLPDRACFPERVVTAGASRLCGTWADRPDGRRRSERVPASGEVALRKLGGFAFQVPLGDVSSGGCKVELVEGIDVDDRVVARFPGLEPLGARVAWSDSRTAGVHFDGPIHPAVFELLLSRLD